MADDPYRILEVGPDVSDAELRAAYRRAAQRHHPDHNAGSAEAARRFEEVQEAYARIRAQRQAPPADPAVEDRLAELERELRRGREARERATREAREESVRQAPTGAGPPPPGRPSDEELGYIRTEDSFGRIIADAAEGLLERLDEFGHDTRSRRGADQLADVLDEVSARLRARGRR